MFEGYLRRHKRRVEAVGRRMGGYHRHRTLSVAPVESLIEVRLLGLGREPRGRAAPLHVDDDKRKLCHHRKSHSLGLQRESRTGGGRHRKVAGKGRAYRRTDAGYLVLRLQGLCPQTLVNRKFFQDGRRRRYGVGTAEERQPGLLRCREQPPGRSLIAGDVAVCPFRKILDRLDYIGVRYDLKVRCIVESVLQHLPVRGRHLRMLLGELPLQVFEDVVQRTVVDEAGHAESEHILALHDGLVVQAAVLEALGSHRGDGRDNQSPVIHTELLERVVGREARLAHTGLVEGVLVHENHGVALAPLGVGLQRRRIHRDKQVAIVARSGNLAVADMYLETGHARHGAMRGANLRRIVRKGGKSVAIDGRHIRKKRPGELHSVTRISCKSDHHVIGVNDFMLHYEVLVSVVSAV